MTFELWLRLSASRARLPELTEKLLKRLRNWLVSSVPDGILYTTTIPRLRLLCPRLPVLSILTIPVFLLMAWMNGTTI